MSWIVTAVVGGTALGGILGGSRSKAPSQQPYGEAMKESLEAQLELAPDLYAAEASKKYGRPAYAELETGMVTDTLRGGGTQKLEQVKELYRAYLGREPDPTGLMQWMKLPSALSLAEMEQIFAESLEGKAVAEQRSAAGEEQGAERMQRQGMIELMGSTKPMADGRKPGFSESGEFQGMTRLGEDLRKQAASAQREGDISDVQSNIAAYQKVMGEARPETVKQLDSAVSAMNAESQRLTGDTIDKPASLQAVAQGLKGPEFGGMTEGVRAPGAEMALGERGVGEQMAGYSQMQDPFGLRQTMQSQAAEGLAAGGDLTARQRRNAIQTARQASEARGRVYDPLSMVSEVEAVMKASAAEEDRRRGFAGQVLGQEAGIQTGEMGRGIQQTGFNVQQEAARQEANLGRQLTAQEFNTLQTAAREEANLARSADAQRFNVGMGEERRTGDIARELAAADTDVGRGMQQQQINEQMRQQRLQGYMGGLGQVAGLEQQVQGDPLQAIIGRPAGTTGFGMGQQMQGQAGTALTAGPQLYSPESGLSYMLGQQSNQASFAAEQARSKAGMISGGLDMVGSVLGGGLAGGYFKK